MTVCADSNREKLRGRPPKYPGLVAASISLSVSYGHLWACVSGRKISRSLMAKYRKHQSQQAQSEAKL